MERNLNMGGKFTWALTSPWEYPEKKVYVFIKKYDESDECLLLSQYHYKDITFNQTMFVIII